MPKHVLTEEHSYLLQLFKNNETKDFTAEEKAIGDELLKAWGDGTIMPQREAEDAIARFTKNPKSVQISMSDLKAFMLFCKELDKPKYYDLAMRMYIGLNDAGNYNVVIVPVLSLKKGADGLRAHEKDLEKTVFDLIGKDFFAINTALPFDDMFTKNITDCQKALTHTDPTLVKLAFYGYKNLDAFKKGVNGKIDRLLLQFAINEDSTSKEQKLTIIISFLDNKGKKLTSKMPGYNNLIMEGEYMDKVDLIPPPPRTGTLIDDSHFN